MIKFIDQQYIGSHTLNDRRNTFGVLRFSLSQFPRECTRRRSKERDVVGGEANRFWRRGIGGGRWPSKQDQEQ